MVGQNCALYGCSTSRTHEGRSLFKIPTVGAADGEETTALKKTAREECRVVLFFKIPKERFLPLVAFLRRTCQQRVTKLRLKSVAF